MTLPSSSNGSSPAVLQTLAWCRKNDFRPVPLHVQSKAAISRRYAEPGYNPPPDSFWQDSSFGIGILTGPASGGPVDVDLDCPEAIFFASRFLPPTPAVFGRASKPSSHYLYRVDVSTLDKRAMLDPIQKATIIEIRADGGHQTVLPGSLHQDTGELIEWSSVPFPDVPRVEVTQLSKGVRLISIATLIARHFWSEGQRNEIVKHLSGLFFYLDWPEEDVRSLIEAVTEYLEDTDKTRLLTVAATYKKAARGGKVTGAATLRKFVDPVAVDRILEWAGSPVVNLMQEYNERYCVVSIEGKFRVADTDVPPGEAPIFIQKDDFLNFRSTDYVTIDDKSVSKARLWLANPRRRSYRSLDFLPGLEDPLDILNLWTGWSAQPQKGDCEGWMTLLHEVICGRDQSLMDWMLNWFANIIREPRERSMTAPVIIGRQGAGKSLLLAYFGRILGPAYTVITNEEHIYGRFNKHLATTLLLHSEEALYGGELKHRGIIKSLITDEFRIFEPKGVDAKQVRNYLRLVLTSNLPHAAPAESSDRRFTVIDLGDRVINPTLLKKVVEELNSTGPSALFQYLLDMKYDRTIPRLNVKNEALGLLKSINHTPIESWWHEVLSSGFVLPDYLSWAQEPANEPWPKIVSSVALYASMTMRLRDRGIRAIPNETLFSMLLNKFVGIKLWRHQKRFTNPMSDDAPQAVRLISNRQQTITNLPNLTDCRKAFSMYVGQPLDWPEDEPEFEKPAHERY